jgi:ketosteroid isomerase-like protein
MLNRDDAVELIKEAYGARVRGDKEALARYWSDGAHFEIIGNWDLLSNVTLSASTPMNAISDLIDRFAFSDLELLDSVVEGNKVAARWRVTVAVDGKPPRTTQLFDLIELSDEGKIRSLVQFADTALVRHLAG